MLILTLHDYNNNKPALPEAIFPYRHAILAFKLLRQDDEYMLLNFQISKNERETKMRFLKRQNFDVGKNILLNRLHILDNNIEKKTGPI